MPGVYFCDDLLIVACLGLHPPMTIFIGSHCLPEFKDNCLPGEIAPIARSGRSACSNQYSNRIIAKLNHEISTSHLMHDTDI